MVSSSSNGETFCDFVRCTFQRYNQGIDYRWRSSCNFAASVRKDLFFSKSHLDLHKIILLIYLWADQAPQKNHTSINWFISCCNICANHLINQCEPIGSVEIINSEVVPKVVEIDGSKLFHSKYHC